MAPMNWIFVGMSSGTIFMSGVVLDGSTGEQSLGVRADDARRSSGWVLEGRSGLVEVQRERWGRKYLRGMGNQSAEKEKEDLQG